MKKISSITAFGFLVLFIPYAGIPRYWVNIVLFICGLAIIILSFLIRRELYKVIRIFHGVEEVKSDTYVENNPQ
jgi:hypothetical protein